MTSTDASLTQYLHDIQATLATKQATEPSYYPDFKKLVESLGDGVTATSLPKHIECGAPDFLVAKGQLTIGYIEAKDLGKGLDEIEKSDQLKRYRQALPNLILTNYLEFRWYQNGERVLKVELGTETDGKVKPTKQGREDVARLFSAFLGFDAPGVGTAKELARGMARLAHRIREGAEEALDKHVASDMLTDLYQAFQTTLIPGLEVKVFADMYAQTIAYGLFAARCETANATAFSRQQAAYLIPKTNPFLKSLFEQITGTALDDEPYKWAVDELVQLLRKAEMTEVMKGFGKPTGKDDPVVYFYEDFLREYDKKLSEMRGVYYTPLPVVSYIVRSIDYLLKTRFNRPQGLADENTYILDPATGTGTFLYAVINEIYESMSKQGQLGQWDGTDGYVAKHLLPRILGFEILMAPYVVAHLKLGLQLKETHYQFPSNQRLGVYLTNTLEEAVKSTEMLMGQYIVKEANAAADIKKEKPIMVVLGNPPYSGISANDSLRTFIDQKTGKTRQELTWIGSLIEDYKTVDGKPLGERKTWLQNDYVKFLRFGQWRVERTKQGILGYITDNSYLDGPTFRGMRQSLLNSFSDIYILNLHGNSNRKEIAPEGGKDENVFDIQQGVAIAVFVKEPGNTSPAKLHYADFWGLRETKYKTLVETDIHETVWKQLTPNTPYYFFVPSDEGLRPEYDKGWRLPDIFSLNRSGIITARDEFVVDFDPGPIKNRIELFLDKAISDEEVKERLSLSENYMWRVSAARKQLMSAKDWQSFFKNILYRPFDIRSIYYHTSVVWRTRQEVMHHVLAGQNLVLVMSGQTKDPFGAFVTNQLVAHKAVARYDVNYAFPLYLYPTEGAMAFETGRRPNLNPNFIKDFSAKLGLKFVEDGKGDLTETFGPEDIFHYGYAIFHSPTYRTRYAEFLKTDFPRLPLTSDKNLFKALAEKGEVLVSLHLMESPALATPVTRYPIPGSNIVDKVDYEEKTKRVSINKTQHFEGVLPEVWKFQVGGYQVCQKWLKDRKGRTLSADDITHYQRIVVALKETTRLMAEIDALIPAWPIT